MRFILAPLPLSPISPRLIPVQNKVSPVGEEVWEGGWLDERASGQSVFVRLSYETIGGSSFWISNVGIHLQQGAWRKNKLVNFGILKEVKTIFSGGGIFCLIFLIFFLVKRELFCLHGWKNFCAAEQQYSLPLNHKTFLPQKISLLQC